MESFLEGDNLVHGLVFKLGYTHNMFVMNALLHAYAVCNSLMLAQKVFIEMPERNIISWNSMIDGYCQKGDFCNACTLFMTMRDSGVKPDGFTLVSLLSLCSRTRNLELGKSLHQHIVVAVIDVDLILGNALVDMYRKCGELSMAQACFARMPVKNVISWTSLVCAYAKHGLLDLARSLFDSMTKRSVVTWNAMISCYIQCERYLEGLNLYTLMQNLSVTPDEATLVSVLSASSQTGHLVVGKKIHGYICEHIANPSITLFNSVIDMYSKCGHVDVALSNFSMMKERNVVSWNVMVGALAMHGCGLDAVELFGRMVKEGFSPDGITFVGLLGACSHGGLLEFGQHYFRAMQLVYKIPYEIEHYACMVDLLGRRGLFVEAVELVGNMQMKPDVVIWGALLGACRIHGNMFIAKQVMKQVLELDPYSGGLYVLLSNIFCETCRWDDMKRLRRLMKEKGIRKGKATSFIELKGHVYEFMVNDFRHENSRYICMLTSLTDHMMSLGCPSDPMGRLWHGGE